jgi:hypothetical protein
MQEVCAVSRRASAAGPALLANFNPYARASLVSGMTVASVADASGVSAHVVAATADAAEAAATANTATARAAAGIGAEATEVARAEATEVANEGASMTGAVDLNEHQLSTVQCEDSDDKTGGEAAQRLLALQKQVDNFLENY